MTSKTRQPDHPQPAPPAANEGERGAAARLSRGCEGLLDLSVVVLATWTVVYHVCLLLGLGVLWAVGLEALALAGAGVLWWWTRRNSAAASLETGPGGRLDVSIRARVVDSFRGEWLLFAAVLVFGSVTAAMVAVEVEEWWPAISVLWLVAAVLGTAWAALRFRFPEADPVGAGDGSGWVGLVVALVWAVVLAVFSMFTRWPNPDDLYYVNLSQWVVDNGTFPLRDTIFSDLEFPMSSWPPMASYDALVGALAWLGGVPAATVVYLIVPPVATFLSVLALWQLLRAWRVRAVAVALSLALVFLLVDGGSGYAAPGNLFLTRLWQGKVILLCLLVPLLLVYAVRYVERPTLARAVWLFAGGAAAVGLSTTGIFLVPLIAACGAAPLVFDRPLRALVGFLAMAAYPLAAGAVTLAVGGRSADFFGTRNLFRFDPAWFGQEIFRDGALALVAVFAVLAGALLVPHRAARLTTGLLVIVFGVTFVPGVTWISYDLVGLGPTLWRISWVASIAALVGVLGARLASSSSLRSVRIAAPVMLAAVLVMSGQPIWTPDYGVTVDSSPNWKRQITTIEAAERLFDVAQPGEVVLASQELSITIAVLTTEIKTIAPRAYFMEYLRDDPDFQYDERMTLTDFANGEMVRTSEVDSALTQLDVRHVCMPRLFDERVDFLQRAGYSTSTGTPIYTCLSR